MPKPRASIRGLGDRLRQEGSAAVEEHPIEALAGDGRQIVNIPLGAITPNPNQPRKHFDKVALDELAESIRTKGLLQPIIVKRQDDGRFLLVAGERRFRACGLAGLAKIPAVVTTGDELEIAIIENLQREDLKPLEEAEALDSLAKSHGYSQERLALVVGKARTSVNETLSLLRLPPTIREECRTFDTSKAQLLQIARMNDPVKQRELWDVMKTGNLPVRAARTARAQGVIQQPTKHTTRTLRTANPRATVTIRIEGDAKPQEFVEVIGELWERAKQGSLEHGKR